MYQGCSSCWRTPQPRGRLSLSNRELTVSALSLESCTDGVGFLSKPELEVSALYSTVIASQVVLDSLALLLVDARSSPFNLASDTK